MPSAFRIYDEQALNRRLRLKRVQILGVFVLGAGCGLWLSASTPGQALAAPPPALAATPGLRPVALASTGCAGPVQQTTRLRLDCELKFLPR